jgi:hypothetical protein
MGIINKSVLNIVYTGKAKVNKPIKKTETNYYSFKNKFGLTVLCAKYKYIIIVLI